MKSSNKGLTAALLIVVLVAAQTLATFADTRKDPKKRRLSDEQRIIHVLNRLGFGARPGDVERVKAMGLENYIQLNAKSAEDSES